MVVNKNQPPLLVGWREWIALPELGIDKIKAKVDTGARTSALHAFELNPFKRGKQHKIRFSLHPIQRREDLVVTCTADIHDIRWVTDSGGHKERRYIILTKLQMAGDEWPIEITLTNRDTMNFRMLLGRSAMPNKIMVDPSASFLTSLG